MYRNRFKIKYVIDKECDRLFHGIPVYSFETKKEEIKREFVIIAVERTDTYREISDLLKQNSMEESKSYLWMYRIDKKLAILYGNCHFIILMQYLRCNFEFNKKYHIEHYYIADPKENWRYPDQSVLKYCDVFISQDIREGNTHGVPCVDDLFKRTNSVCIKIKVPNLHGYNFFFPQSGLTPENIVDRHLSENGVKNDTIRRACRLVTGWNDKNIESMYEKGYKIDEIVDAIENIDIYTPEEIVENFNKELKRLQQRETYCDIKISDYMLQNYKRKQLFYDFIHPANDIIFEKGRRILFLLHIEPVEALSVKDTLDESELFIYGCVKRALGIVYEQRYVRCHNMQGTLYNRAIDMKEYVKSYIAWHYMDE